MNQATIFIEVDEKTSPWITNVSYRGVTKTLTGERDNKTLNQCEIIALLVSLRYLKGKWDVTIFTKSEYLQNGVMFWLSKWKSNGWKTEEGHPIKNKKLWKSLLFELSRHSVVVHLEKANIEIEEIKEIKPLQQTKKKVLKSSKKVAASECRVLFGSEKDLIIQALKERGML